MGTKSTGSWRTAWSARMVNWGQTKDGSLRRPRRAAGWEGSRRRARSRKCGFACPGVVLRTLMDRARGSRLSRSIERTGYGSQTYWLLINRVTSRGQQHKEVEWPDMGVERGEHEKEMDASC